MRLPHALPVRAGRVRRCRSGAARSDARAIQGVPARRLAGMEPMMKRTSTAASRRRDAVRAPASDLIVAMRERAGALSTAHQQVAAVMLEDPEFALHASVE